MMWEPAMSSVSSLTSCQCSGAVTLSFPITVAAKGRCSLGLIIPDTPCCVGPNWCTASPFSDIAVSPSLPVKPTAYFGGKLQHITRNQSLTRNVLRSTDANSISCLLYPTVKKFWKSVNIWWSYCKNSTPRFFEAQCILYYIYIYISLVSGWCILLNVGEITHSVVLGIILIAGGRGCNSRTFLHNESIHPSTTAL